MGLVLLLSLGVSACSFQFSYQSISAPLGTVGDVGIQVQKTHNNCVLSSMDEYLIEGRGVQILGETVWEDLGGGLYEKWVQLSLATLGDGSLTISKTCIKDGYEEKVLPILTQSAEAADAVWMLAWNGTYPFEATGDILSVVGTPVLADDVLTVGSVSVVLPVDVELPQSLPNSVRLFTLQTSGGVSALLLVGEGFFVRFDHLLS